MFLSPELLESRSFTSFSMGSLTPAATGAATCAEQNFDVPLGTPVLKVTDMVLVMAVTASGNAVALVSGRVVDADTIAFKFCNPTAGALTHAASVVNVVIVRP